MRFHRTLPVWPRPAGERPILVSSRFPMENLIFNTLTSRDISGRFSVIDRNLKPCTKRTRTELEISKPLMSSLRPLSRKAKREKKRTEKKKEIGIDPRAYNIKKEIISPFRTRTRNSQSMQSRILRVHGPVAVTPREEMCEEI